MEREITNITAAASFNEANEVVTKWLGLEKKKPGSSEFAAIEAAFPSWRDECRSHGDALEGLAFLGRLWALASWRATEGVSSWTRRTSSDLLEYLSDDTLVSDIAFWGGANERRFVTNAVEVLETERARKIVCILLASESHRNSTKVTAHHLASLRTKRVTMEQAVEGAPEVWRILSKDSRSSDSSLLIQFENMMDAISASAWKNDEIGNPNLVELPLSIRSAAQRGSPDLRNSAAESFLRLLENYRIATPRRSDVVQGFLPACGLLHWFPGKRFASALEKSLAAMLDDLERDLVWQLELGRRDGELRRVHEQLAGQTQSAARLTKCANSSSLNEQSSIWLRTGKRVDFSAGDHNVAEFAAQELDPLIAEIMIELAQVSAPRDPHLADALRRTEALARARGLVLFGGVGTVIEFDSSRHDLVDDSIGRSNRVAVFRSGVLRERGESQSVIVKAKVQNAEF